MAIKGLNCENLQGRAFWPTVSKSALSTTVARLLKRHTASKTWAPKHDLQLVFGWVS